MKEENKVDWETLSWPLWEQKGWVNVAKGLNGSVAVDSLIEREITVKRNRLRTTKINSSS